MDTYSSNPNSINNMNTQQPLPNATAVLVLGIISLVMCGPVGLVCGIISLNMANRAKADYQANPTLYTQASYSNVNSGRVCGLIGVILSALAIVFLILYFIFVFTMVDRLGGFRY